MSLVLLLIIPVKSTMLHLTTGIHIPPQHKLRPLKQMASQLDVSYICRVVLRVDIVVLQDTSCIEVVHEAAVLEVLVHILGFLLVGDAGVVV